MASNFEKIEGQRIAGFEENGAGDIENGDAAGQLAFQRTGMGVAMEDGRDVSADKGFGHPGAAEERVDLLGLSLYRIANG